MSGRPNRQTDAVPITVMSPFSSLSNKLLSVYIDKDVFLPEADLKRKAVNAFDMIRYESLADTRLRLGSMLAKRCTSNHLMHKANLTTTISDSSLNMTKADVIHIQQLETLGQCIPPPRHVLPCSY